jgi:hypothetical protein
MWTSDETFKTCNGSQAEFTVYMVDPFTLQEAVAGHLPSWRIDALLWETSETHIEQARPLTWVHQGKQSTTGTPYIAKACYGTVVDESQITQCWVSLWLIYHGLLGNWNPVESVSYPPTHPSIPHGAPGACCWFTLADMGGKERDVCGWCEWISTAAYMVGQ